LREKYFGEKQKSWFKPEDEKFKDFSEVEDYIDRVERKRARIPFRTQFMTTFNEYFMVRVGSKSLYFWHSRQFTEIFQMHIPRLLFLSGAIYTIYKIKLRQTRAAQWKEYVTSHRQEEIDK